MKKEQHTSPAVGLSDEAIIEGLRNRDPQITRDYFYGPKGDCPWRTDAAA